MRRRFKNKWIIILIFTIIIYGINWYYEFFALNIPCHSIKGDKSFRVMTYNVNAAKKIDNIDAFKNGLIKEIVKQSPDVLCLQELSLSNFEKIQTSLDSLFGYTDSMEIRKEPLRYCLYSKKPIRNFKRYKCVGDLGVSNLDSCSIVYVEQIKKLMPIVSAEVEIDNNTWITVFSCHLHSNAYSKARLSMSDDASWIEGVPLYYSNYKTGKAIRDYEAVNIRKHIDSLLLKGNSVLFAGDLNSSWGSFSLKTIKSNNLNDAWWSNGFGLGITFDAWHLKLRLDHILFSNHLEIQKVFVAQSVFSDHRPLVADFLLKRN